MSDTSDTPLSAHILTRLFLRVFHEKADNLRRKTSPRPLKRV